MIFRDTGPQVTGFNSSALVWREYPGRTAGVATSDCCSQDESIVFLAWIKAMSVLAQMFLTHY